MLTNDQMKPGRFLRWHKARKRVAFIREHLEAGHTIQLTTYTKCWRFAKLAHIELFKATKSGCYMRRGKNWDCIDGIDCRAFG